MYALKLGIIVFDLVKGNKKKKISFCLILAFLKSRKTFPSSAAFCWFLAQGVRFFFKIPIEIVCQISDLKKICKSLLRSVGWFDVEKSSKYSKKLVKITFQSNVSVWSEKSEAIKKENN